MLTINPTDNNEIGPAFERAKLAALDLCDILKKSAKGKAFETLSTIETRIGAMVLSREGLEDMVAIQSELQIAFIGVRRKLLFKVSALALGGLIVIAAVAWYDTLLWLREGKSPLLSVIVVISGLGGGIGGYSIISRVGKFVKRRSIGETPLFTSIFYLLIPERDREYLLGDMDEEFSAVLHESGAFKAYVHYYYEIAGFILPYLLRLLRRAFRRNKFSGLVQK